MKTSGYLILYISENDDLELWRALSQISSEERASVVKSALRRALLGEKNSGTGGSAKHNIQNRTERSIESPAADLALDELGMDQIQSVSDEELIKLDRLDLVELDDFLHEADLPGRSSLPGLNFLLTKVIGEEDNEEIIEYIKKSKNMLEKDA